jgi:hypothetical protein
MHFWVNLCACRVHFELVNIGETREPVDVDIGGAISLMKDIIVIYNLNVL